MLRKKPYRRTLALVLVGLGGLLIYLAPSDFAGLVLLVSGIAIELAGIALERTS